MISRRKFFGMAGAGAAFAVIGPPVVAAEGALASSGINRWLEREVAPAIAAKAFHVEQRVAHNLTGYDLIRQIEDLSP